MNRRAKEVLKLIGGRFAYWAVIYGALLLALFIVLVFNAANLLDVKLIVSLVVAEIPLAVLFEVVGHRNKVRDAVERVRSMKDLAHLRIHRFGVSGLISWYYVENVRTRFVYDAPQYFITLAKSGILEIVEHDNEKDMKAYLKSNGLNLEDRHPNPLELV